MRPPSGPTTVDPCLADIGLWLEVEAPNDKKPDGADGNLDDIAIPSGSLEGGFEVTLPAQDRVITLDDPGANWELTSTTCSCSGWTTLSAAGGSDMAALPGSATSYPGPVIAVRPLESGGPGSCTGVGAAAVASAPPALLRATGGPSELATYPGPVIAVRALQQAPRVEWDDAGTITITDPDAVGGTFTCTWTVELLYGTLELETVTTPSGEEGRFRYRIEPTGGQPEAAAISVRGSSSDRLRWGPWSVDLEELPEGWEVKRSSCSESDTSLLSLAQGPAAQVGLDGDDRVSCRFELELLAPKPGRWKANNKPGKVTCSGGGGSASFPLDTAIDFTRMQVRDEGDTLVIRGGGNRYTFRRERDDPLRYRGTKRFRQGGYTLDFDIRLDLKTETRMTGVVRSVGKGRGAKCTFQRPLTMRHASD